MKKKYKTVVVGSGPGGSITALNLLKSGNDVLLIEKGSFTQMNQIKEYSYDEMINKYNNAGLTLAHGIPNINYVEGSCFGGGSEINSGLYHRLPDPIFDTWKNEFSLEYDKKQLDQYYEQNENKLNISFADKKDIPLASLKLKKGSDKLNYKCIEIPRWVKKKNEKLVKQSMTQTYLQEYIDLGGKYLLNTNVSKINKVNNKLELDLISNNETYKISTEKLFLAAGAIHSPFLLLNSGIKKNIGNSLKLHPSFKFLAKFSEDVNFNNMGVPVHQVKHFDKISMGCSVSSKGYIGASLSDSGNLNKLEYWKKMASYYIMISPIGKGNVRKIPFINTPIVDFKMNSSDFNNLFFGIEELAQILFKSGAQELYPSASFNQKINSMKDVSSLLNIDVNKLNLMTIHLFSSLRMGGDKDHFATDPFGKLWNHENIYINDGSILCDSPSVNPQGTIMAFSNYNINNFLNTNNGF